jgi:lysophospholipase L1-like esterase
MRYITILLLFFYFNVFSQSCACAGYVPPTVAPAPDPVYTGDKITFPENAYFYAYGNSITAGYNATVTDSIYSNRLAAYLNNTVVNRGGPGQTMSGIWTTYMSDKNSGIDSAVTISGGTNDVNGINQLHAAQILELRGYHKSMAVYQFLKAGRLPMTSSVITKSGTWDSSNTNLVSSVHSKYITSSTDGSTLTYTFTDSTLVIGALAGDGVTYLAGAFKVTIDGVLQGSYAFSGYGVHGYTPQAIIFRGMTYASHTVVITKVGTTKTVLDYMGHLKPAATCKPVILIGIPPTRIAQNKDIKGKEYYRYATTLMCTAIQDLYGYPVAFAATDLFIDTEVDIDSDLVHPTDSGHRKIFLAEKAVLTN